MRNKAPRQKGVDDREDKEGPLLPPRIRKMNYECILKMCFKGGSSIEIEIPKVVVLFKFAFACVNRAKPSTFRGHSPLYYCYTLGSSPVKAHFIRVAIR